MHKGFTLLELLIVIGIIAILAGAVVPIFRYTKLQTEINKAQQDVEVIRGAVLRFNMDTGEWPPQGDDGDLTCLITNTNPGCPTEAEGWNGPYLSEWQNDPWRYSNGEEGFPQPYKILYIPKPCPPDIMCTPVMVPGWVQSLGPDNSDDLCNDLDCSDDGFCDICARIPYS